MDSEHFKNFMVKVLEMYNDELLNIPKRSKGRPQKTEEEKELTKIRNRENALKRYHEMKSHKSDISVS